MAAIEELLGGEGLGTWYSVGAVLNPKTREPVLVYQYARRHVRIYSGGHLYGQEGGFEGTGHFSRPTDSEPAHISGFPRVHVPNAVPRRGAGFGSALYFGLCLTAHANIYGKMRLPIVPGDGISSTSSSRSKAADVWWHAAQERGLADSGTITVRGRGVTLNTLDFDVLWESNLILWCQVAEQQDAPVPAIKGEATVVEVNHDALRHANISRLPKKMQQQYLKSMKHYGADSAELKAVKERQKAYKEGSGARRKNPAGIDWDLLEDFCQDGVEEGWDNFSDLPDF